MKLLRQWKAETLWLLGLCTVFAVIGFAAPASASADRWIEYDGAANWCYLLQEKNCLWQEQ
jgi:hypothetical protein